MRIPAPVRRLFPALLVLAAFGFLGAEIVRNLDQLRTFDWSFDAGILLGSVLLLGLVLLLGVVVWSVLLTRFGVKSSVVPLARAWFLSNLSRYIPGVVWQFVSLAQLGGGAGLTPAVAVTSMLVQMGFMVLGAGLVGVYLLPVELAGSGGAVVVGLRWVAPVALLGVHPRLIRTMLAAAARLTRREPLEWSGSWVDGVLLLALAVLAWLAYGVAFFLFLRSFVELPISMFPAVAAANALAFMAGYLAVPVPGGLGVKEAALGILLAGFMPPAVAASLAVVARLWNIAGETIPALILLRNRPRPGTDSALRAPHS